jgi:hypothetical protein
MIVTTTTAPPVIVDPGTPPVVVTPTGDATPFEGFGALPPFQRLTAQWRSWAGDVWTITDPASPVFALQDATGFGMADPDHWWDEAPALDGGSWLGMHAPRGQVDIPIRVDGATPEDFLSNHAAFVRSLDPRKESTFAMILPNGQTRTSRFRYLTGLDGRITLDPLMVRRATYVISWSRDPYWSGDDITQSFAADTPPPFFPGPPFILGSGSTLVNATATNPGDVDAPARWRAWGPFTSLQVGVGTSLVKVTVTKAAGQWVDIDLRPTKNTVKDETGADIRSLVTEFANAPIPAGATVPLAISLNGSGVGSAVDLTFTPQYRSAY